MADYDLHDNVEFYYTVDNSQVPAPFQATVGHSVYEHWFSDEMGHLRVPRSERFWDMKIGGW